MLKQILIGLLLLVANILLAQSPDGIAYQQILEIKEGVILVRLHTDDEVIKKMNELKQYKTLKDKKAEILAKNKETYMAFSTGFTFTKVYFFYGRDSERIKTGKYDSVFIDADLKVSPQIIIPENLPVYLLDVGDIHFDAFAGGMEGVAVLDKDFNMLKKPFPYYVRKRSGLSIVKRTDLDMALKLQHDFEEFYKKAERLTK